MQITDPKTIKSYYEALVERKQNYLGIFYVGVKTTMVFCIATCRARKPKKENVIFYSTFKEALAEGYRPCKICKPTENAHKAPEQVAKAISMVKERTKEKIKDEHLRQLDISPAVVRRWFKQHYGMTFQAYQRMYRINIAFQELKQGKNATQTAFDNGYESLSGFGYTFKKLVGNSPKNSQQTQMILINRHTTPLGPIFIGATEKGICLLEFTDRRMLETEMQDLQKLLHAQIISGENTHILLAKNEIDAYFAGKLKAFTVTLDTPGTDFQQTTWKALQDIPFGKTVSYQEQAHKIGNPQAVRAVAKANGLNRVAIIIPCHRVIGSNGQLTGYAGGLERKQWLLDHEHNQMKLF